MQGGIHTIQFGVGTPPQYIDLQIDTGSSDFWLVSNTDSVESCQGDVNQCAAFGTFNKDASTSKEAVFTKESVGSNNPVQQSFKVNYVDGSGAVGFAYKDNVVIAGRSVAGVQFGLASKSSQWFGILGLGFAEAQSAVRFNRGPSYPSLLQILVQQKIIRVKAFSLWLGDEHGATGSILFGGVDTAKIDGELTTLSIQARDDYTVHADAINFGKSSSVLKSFSGTVQIDSGQTMSFLPDDMVATIWKETKAQLYSPAGATGVFKSLPFVDCGLSSVFLEFNFGTTKINIPISKFTYENADPPSDGPQCLLAILPQIKLYKKGRGQPVLGGKFLEIAYVVHDLDNRQISIAKAKSTASSAVVELGPDGVGALNLGKSEGESGDKALELGAADAEEEPWTPSSDSDSTTESVVVGEQGSGEQQASTQGTSGIISNEQNPGEPGAKALVPSDVSKAEPQASETSLFSETNPTENVIASSDGMQVSHVAASEGVENDGATPGGNGEPSFLSFNPPSTNDRGASFSDGLDPSDFAV